MRCNRCFAAATSSTGDVGRLRRPPVCRPRPAHERPTPRCSGHGHASAVPCLRARWRRRGSGSSRRSASAPPPCAPGCVTAGSSRLRRGAYVEGLLWREADRDSRYRLTVTAVLRSRGVAEAASHHSAVALHRLPLWDVNQARGCRGHERRPGDHHHRRASRHATQGAGGRGAGRGTQILAVADAVVTTAASSVEAGVVAADAALHRGVVSVQELREAHHRLARGLRGTARLRRALSSLDPAAESRGRAGLDWSSQDSTSPSRPKPCFATALDVSSPGWTSSSRAGVVEFDGAVKYAGADGRDALVAEKRREDELRALGYEVVRLVWADLSRPDRVLAMVRSALGRCCRRRTPHQAAQHGGSSATRVL